MTLSFPNTKVLLDPRLKQMFTFHERALQEVKGDLLEIFQEEWCAGFSPLSS